MAESMTSLSVLYPQESSCDNMLGVLINIGDALWLSKFPIGDGCYRVHCMNCDFLNGSKFEIDSSPFCLLWSLLLKSIISAIMLFTSLSVFYCRCQLKSWNPGHDQGNLFCPEYSCWLFYLRLPQRWLNFTLFFVIY